MIFIKKIICFIKGHVMKSNQDLIYLKEDANVSIEMNYCKRCAYSKELIINFSNCQFEDFIWERNKDLK